MVDPLHTYPALIENILTHGAGYDAPHHTGDTVFDVQLSLLLKEYQQGHVTKKGKSVYAEQLFSAKERYAHKAPDADEISSLMDAMDGPKFARDELEIKRNISYEGFSLAEDSLAHLHWEQKSASTAYSPFLSYKETKDLIGSKLLDAIKDNHWVHPVVIDDSMYLTEKIFGNLHSKERARTTTEEFKEKGIMAYYDKYYFAAIETPAYSDNCDSGVDENYPSLLPKEICDGRNDDCDQFEDDTDSNKGDDF